MAHLLIAIAAALAGPAAAQTPARPTRVAAAANLQPVLPLILAAMPREGLGPGPEGRIEVVYGVTGAFRRQIAEGAPFDVFLAADEDSVLALAREGHLRDEGAAYAVGRLALFAAAGSPVAVEAGLEGLGASLRAGAVTRLAIANPETAPYGRAAVEALRAMNLWDAAQPRLVIGDSIAQAAQFAASGGAQAGLIALSTVRAPGFEGRGAHSVVPSSLHAPIRQRMGIVRGLGRGDSEAARRFYEHMSSPAAREILVRFGYEAP